MQLLSADTTIFFVPKNSCSKMWLIDQLYIKLGLALGLLRMKDFYGQVVYLAWPSSAYHRSLYTVTNRLT